MPASARPAAVHEARRAGQLWALARITGPGHSVPPGAGTERTDFMFIGIGTIVVIVIIVLVVLALRR